MLMNSLQCTGKPSRMKNYPDLHVNSPRIKNPALNSFSVCDLSHCMGVLNQASKLCEFDYTILIICDYKFFRNNVHCCFHPESRASLLSQLAHTSQVMFPFNFTNRKILFRSFHQAIPHDFVYSFKIQLTLKLFSTS